MIGHKLCAALFVASTLVACGTPTQGGDASDAASDAISDVTALDVADAAVDTGVDVSWPMCSVPAPQLPSTPAASALANAPARCGQAPHTWLTDPTLGTIVMRGEHVPFTATTLRAIASGASPAVASLVRYGVEGDVIEYVTQDRGHLVQATGFIARPVGLTAATTADVVLFTHGTSGFNDQCAPSRDSTSRALAALLASMGFIVVAPDYLGMKSLGDPSAFPHPYLVGQATAIASLDAVRAAIRFVAAEGGPLCASSRFATIGGSQGGHAALWVDRLAPYYAGEIRHAGLVATVPPADLTGEATLALQTVINATPNIAAFWATAPPWYGLGTRLAEVFVPPYDTQAPAALAMSCSLSSTGVTSLSAFQPPVLTAAQNNQLDMLDPWGCILRENSLTTTSIARVAPTEPGYGVLYVLGGADELVSTPTERQSFQTLCTQGMQMQYLECMGAGHVQTTFWSLREIVEFVQARFAGQPMVNPCPSALTASRCSGTP